MANPENNENPDVQRAASDLFQVLKTNDCTPSQMLGIVEKMRTSEPWMITLALISSRYNGVNILEVLKSLRELIPQPQADEALQ